MLFFGIKVHVCFFRSKVNSRLPSKGEFRPDLGHLGSGANSYIDGWIIHPTYMNSKKLAMIAILTAASVSSNYAMIHLFNIKLMDLIVFVGGFCFGPLAGASIGIASWAVYGSLNPLGFSFPIWASAMASETIYGLAGGIARRAFNFNTSSPLENHRLGNCFFFAALGMLLTFAYDTITNIVFGYVSGWSVLIAVVVGFVPFGLVHVISNAFFFGLGCVPAIKAMLKIVGGKSIGSPEK